MSKRKDIKKILIDAKIHIFRLLPTIGHLTASYPDNSYFSALKTVLNTLRSENDIVKFKEELEEALEYARCISDFGAEGKQILSELKLAFVIINNN